MVRIDYGARGGAVGWGMRWRIWFRHCAKSRGGSRLRFPMVSVEFFIDIILPTALGPWG